MSEEFNLLGLNENATLEDIQTSFAYLYQMIDLIYPLDKNESIEKERHDELKRLETAYLSALKNIRHEIISNSDDQNIKDSLVELNNIEILLGTNDQNSIQIVSNIKKYKVKDDKALKPIKRKLVVDEIKKTLLYANKNLYHIKNMSEKEITTDSLITNLRDNKIKGEVYFPGKTKIPIVGKIIRKEKNQTTIRLVTRISKKWIHQYNSEKLKYRELTC